MPTRASIAFGRTTIPFQICRSPRRTTVAVTVDTAGSVRVVAPVRIPAKAVAAVVLSKAAWILAQKQRLHDLQPAAPVRRFVSGESIFYLGRTYQLRIHTSKTRISGSRIACRGGCLHVELPRRSSESQRRGLCRRAVVSWLRERARHHATAQCRRACSQLNIAEPSIAIRDLGRRWGSCTTKGRVLVHWRLVMAPMRLVEYVCSHEVCHLVHPNHSIQFRRTLSRLLPDWRVREARLASRGRRFDL